VSQDSTAKKNSIESDAPWGPLSDKQRLAVEMRMTGRSVTQIADELHVNRTTIWRWTKDEACISYHRYLVEQRVMDCAARMKHIHRITLDFYATAIESGNENLAKHWLNVATRSADLLEYLSH
jgi:hypothetical protein